MQTVPRPYGGDIERTASSFTLRMPLYLLRVPSPRGDCEFLSLNIILSEDSLRRYDKESTRTTTKRRTDSSRYIFLYNSLRGDDTKNFYDDCEFLSLNIILSEDSLRRYDKESTRTTTKRRTDSSRYIFIYNSLRGDDTKNFYDDNTHHILFHFCIML